MSKLMDIFIKTKREPNTIRSDMLAADITIKAKKDNKLFKYNETSDTSLCLYRTNYNDYESVIIIFVLDIHDKKKGSCISDLTFGLVRDVGRCIGAVDYHHFSRGTTSKGNEVGFLKMIKIIKDDDVI